MRQIIAIYHESENLDHHHHNGGDGTSGSSGGTSSPDVKQMQNGGSAMKTVTHLSPDGKYDVIITENDLHTGKI